MKRKYESMITFTSSLPDQLLMKLDSMAKELNVPKNKLIERALRVYLDQVNRSEYVTSYKKAGQDEDIMSIAEEGMAEYLTNLSETDEAKGDLGNLP